jgi:hypothetical protein
MEIKDVSDIARTTSGKQFVLQLPNRFFRFRWLAVGLITGYIVLLFGPPGIILLALLAALTGVSANWSS